MSSKQGEQSEKSEEQKEEEEEKPKEEEEEEKSEEKSKKDEDEKKKPTNKETINKCLELKDKSNDFFRKKDYQSAVDLYQKILKELDKSEYWKELEDRISAGMLCVTCYSNMSLICLKVGTVDQKRQAVGITSKGIERVREILEWKIEIQKKESGEEVDENERRMREMYRRRYQERGSSVNTEFMISSEEEDPDKEDIERILSSGGEDNSITNILTKLYFRRGTANNNIKDYKASIRDIKSCIQLNPGKKNFTIILRKWKNQYTKHVKQTRSAFSSFFKEDDDNDSKQKQKQQKQQKQPKEEEEEEEKEEKKGVHIIISDDHVQTDGIDLLSSLYNQLHSNNNKITTTTKIISCLEFSHEFTKGEVISKLNDKRDMGRLLRKDMESGKKFPQILKDFWRVEETNEVLSNIIMMNSFGLPRIQQFLKFVNNRRIINKDDDSSNEEGDELKFIDAEKIIAAGRIPGTFGSRSHSMASEIKKLDEKNISTVSLIWKKNLLDYPKGSAKEGDGVITLLRKLGCKFPVVVINPTKNMAKDVDYSRMDKSVQKAMNIVMNEEVEALTNIEIKRISLAAKYKFVEYDRVLESSSISEFCKSQINQIVQEFSLM